MDERKVREEEYRTFLREGRRISMLWRLALAALSVFGLAAVAFLLIGYFVEGVTFTALAAGVWIGWIEYRRGPVHHYRERVETQRRWVEARKTEIGSGQG